MTLASGTENVPDEKAKARLKRKFTKMMSAIYKEEGASLRVEILQEPEVMGFIDTHAAILDAAFEQTEMSDTMRQRLQESDWMFSGMKTFHELNEAFPSLIREDGSRKPFKEFLKDVQTVDKTYNGRYLKAEYNFANASADMAARWERFEDSDRYLLQYRTQNDGAVRPEHAALHGVTLPASDSFWDTYFPPNGWNCRCTVVQVLRDKYPETDHNEAMRLGREAMTKDTKGMFSFNPGKEGRVFPAYNPYTISRCQNCPRAHNQLAFVPDNPACTGCDKLHDLRKKESTTGLSSDEIKRVRQTALKWADENLPETKLPNGQSAKRLVIENSGKSLIVNKKFFSETFAKNIRGQKIAETMDIATHIGEWLPNAIFVGTEAGKHHDCNFNVYEASYIGTDIICKVKDTPEDIVYTMRIKDED